MTAETPKTITDPSFDRPARPIGDLVMREEFPQCALGEHVDIGGFEGIIVQVANRSIRVRARTGAVQSFNSHVLRKLYGTIERPPPTVSMASESRAYERPRSKSERTPFDAPEPEKPAAPPREFIEEPDFSLPARPINEFVDQPDFPRCAYGAHVEIAEFKGVVVELVKQSLKVRAPDGGYRSYNGIVLRKLYGKK